MPDLIPGDEELIQAVGNGDLDAFAEIVRRYQQTAWKMAYRFLGEHHEAEDVVQDAFLKILDAAPRYRPTALWQLLHALSLEAGVVDTVMRGGGIDTNPQHQR